ncbi:efflux RND transporter periplasmic adaptor subunit [Pedobacter sp. L105]|uniref:efflux RND transporter periplasmic adaptor subunit n=1 Tax=Pedobacter sp. L105 TaxID=1641871 RepID=UPI00131E4AED|nr:efflux RND transporter periplasmic adaptor subunit [Pedobacter sp. L105]
MKICRLINYLTLVLLFLSLAVSSCRNSPAQASSLLLKNKIENPVTYVKTYQCAKTEFDYSIESSGKIQPFFIQKVMAASNGLIDICLARNNLSFSKGKLIIQLDTKDLQIGLKRIEESIFNSETNYKSDLLSQESLLKGKRQGVIDTVYRKLKGNNGLSSAELDLKLVKLDLAKSTITAPFSGTLVNVKVQKGMYVKNGDELFTIFSQDELYLEAKILETDIGLIRMGQTAYVTPISSVTKYKATVFEINPMVDDHGMISIKLKLVDTRGLIPGMNASTNILIPQQRVLSVPKEAIVNRSNRQVIFTYENGLAKWNYVTVGRDNGKDIEIKEGLKSGQKVILTNNLQLAHDAPVKEEK